MARPPLRSVSDTDASDTPVELVDERVAWPGTSLFPADKYPGFPPDRVPDTARVDRYENSEWCTCALDFDPLEVTEDFLRDTWGPGKYRVVLWPDGKQRRCAERTVKIVGGKRQRFPGNIYETSNAARGGAERDDDDDDDERDARPASPQPAPVPSREPLAPRATAPTSSTPAALVEGGNVAMLRELATIAFRFLEHVEITASQRVALEREFLMRLAERLDSSSRSQTEITVALLQSGQAGNAALTTAALGLAQGVIAANPNAALSRVAERAQEQTRDSRRALVDTFLKGAAWAHEKFGGDDDGGDDDEAADAIERLLGVPKKDVSEAGLDLVKSFSGYLRSKAATASSSSPAVSAPPVPTPAVVAGPQGAFDPLSPPAPPAAAIGGE